MLPTRLRSPAAVSGFSPSARRADGRQPPLLGPEIDRAHDAARRAEAVSVQGVPVHPQDADVAAPVAADLGAAVAEGGRAAQGASGGELLGLVHAPRLLMPARVRPSRQGASQICFAATAPRATATSSRKSASSLMFGFQLQDGFAPRIHLTYP